MLTVLFYNTWMVLTEQNYVGSYGIFELLRMNVEIEWKPSKLS
jgi:hypothetical protein